MRILGTGLSGLVGSRVVELLSDSFTFTNFSLDTGVDITDEADMYTRITGDREASWVFHLAAYTNVQQAEADRAAGRESTAWKVNVSDSENIARACKDSNKRMLYVDTDYAFDGKNKDASYTEKDPVHPLGWYAETKTEGAKRVMDVLGPSALVIRISNPYRAEKPDAEANGKWKMDFVHKILSRLRQREPVQAARDQLFVPTFIDDIAEAVRALISAGSGGLFHVTGSQAISPFEATKEIAATYAADPGLVRPVSFTSYFRGRAPIPQYAVLSTAKLSNTGVSMRGFADGLAEVYRQEQGV